LVVAKRKRMLNFDFLMRKIDVQYDNCLTAAAKNYSLHRSDGAGQPLFSCCLQPTIERGGGPVWRAGPVRGMRSRAQK
jgi:hypothetical protein